MGELLYQWWSEGIKILWEGGWQSCNVLFVKGTTKQFYLICKRTIWVATVHLLYLSQLQSYYQSLEWSSVKEFQQNIAIFLAHNIKEFGSKCSMLSACHGCDDSNVTTTDLQIVSISPAYLDKAIQLNSSCMWKSCGVEDEVWMVWSFVLWVLGWNSFSHSSTIEQWLNECLSHL